jgi:hypothetical protein
MISYLRGILLQCTRIFSKPKDISNIIENLTFFIIFHQYNFPENTPNIPCFTYLGANEYVKKIISPDTKHPVVYEYDTPFYNPLYQMLNFCDNSIILNIRPPPKQFVGFCQYDMIINENKMKIAIEKLTKYNSMVGFYPYHIDTIFDVLTNENYSALINMYNTINKTTHTLESLSDTPFFLMNTYIIPTWFFVKVQSTLKILLPLIFKLLNYDMRHIAGTLERTNSLIIACAIKEGLLIVNTSDAITDNRGQTKMCERINR